MKTLSLLAMVALVASCHFDKLFSGSGDTPLSHDPPAGLVFGAGPGNARAGQPLTPVQVTVVDSSGTRVAGADSLITVALGTNPSGATLSGAVTTHAVNGVARFADLTIDKPGAGYTLTATVTGLTPDTSAAFDVMPPPTTTGDLTVTTTTTGANLDPDGYTVTANGTNQSIGINGSTTFTGLPSGSQTVALGGVASNCTVTGGNSHSASVPAGGTGSTAFAITCAALPPTTGDLTVTTTTGGTGTDPDGYTVTVDGASQAIAINDTRTFTGLSAGDHSVGLQGVAGNCVVSGQNPRTVPVSAGNTAQTNFAVTCTAPANQPPVVSAGGDQDVLVGLGFTLNGASFTDPDHDGPWNVTIDWGDQTTPASFTAPSEGSIPGSHTYSTLVPATYTLTITVVDGHGNVGTGTKTVQVHL
ncbi:MAG TPA: PKD domain-containing protein [Gemmatimonadales bacterium]|nr:PKD domain-containing protein [Gemmatimonadales bacterium]